MTRKTSHKSTTWSHSQKTIERHTHTKPGRTTNPREIPLDRVTARVIQWSLQLHRKSLPGPPYYIHIQSTSTTITLQMPQLIYTPPLIPPTYLPVLISAGRSSGTEIEIGSDRRKNARQTLWNVLGDDHQSSRREHSHWWWWWWQTVPSWTISKLSRDVSPVQLSLATLLVPLPSHNCRLPTRPTQPSRRGRQALRQSIGELRCAF